MIKYKFAVIIITVLSVIVISGCSTLGKTYKFYSGENRSATEIATIMPFHEMTLIPLGRTEVYLTEIDGKFTEHYNIAIPTYEIAPGEHKVKLGFLLNRFGNEVRGVNPEYMVFTAVAGRTYIVKGNFPETISEGQVIISFWIEDLGSKEVVAGTRPVQAK